MRMQKEKVVISDGRYLIYFSFPDKTSSISPTLSPPTGEKGDNRLGTDMQGPHKGDERDRANRARNAGEHHKDQSSREECR